MAEDIPRRRPQAWEYSLILGVLLLSWAILTLLYEPGTRDRTLGLYTHNHLHLSAPLFQVAHLFALAFLLFFAGWVRCGWIIPMGSSGMILGAIFLHRPDHGLFPGLLLGGLLGFGVGLFFDAIQEIRHSDNPQDESPPE